MTPEEFKEKMNNISETYSDDPESCHFYMDDLMIEVLDSLGYEEGTEIFIETAKWYS